MKGNSDAPACGFSSQIVDILAAKNIEYGSFDVFSDPQVRELVKQYSKWHTFPQLFVKGELVGGLDIIKQLIEDGTFDDEVTFKLTT